jgi:acetyl esterase/lipase
VERDVTYCTAGSTALKMDIYYPRQSDGKLAPVALNVHGGGWTSGDKAHNGSEASDIPQLVARGYLVAAVNYRLAPAARFPAMIEDVKCAVRYLRAHAADYQLNPDHIGAWGCSAGGHLVSLLGLTGPDAGFEGGNVYTEGGYAGYSSSVQAVVDMAGPSDLSNLGVADAAFATYVFGTAAVGDPALVRASPLTYVSAKAPPFLIVHGDMDTTVLSVESQVLYDRLKNAGADATLLMIKNAGHCPGTTQPGMSPTREEITKAIADFFDRHLR